jgi:Domain of unknown function (DUF4262)
MGNSTGGGEMSNASLNECDKRTIANVRENGCEVLHVFDNDHNTPNFSYSIGFPETIKQADVIVFGLPRELMHHMVNEVYSQGKNGLVFVDGVVVSHLIEGFDCVLKSVHSNNVIADYFGTGFWYYYHQELPSMTEAFQIVWPGAVSGQYPWDEGCDPEITDSQPPLYEERKVA